MTIPEPKKPLTQAEREKEIKALAERTAEQQRLKDAQKAMAEQAKQAAEDAQRRMDQMKRQAEDLAKSLRTPAEVWKDSMGEISKLMEEGLIGWETYSRAVEDATRKLEAAEMKKISAPDRPIGGVVQGTAAARSAEFAATSEFKWLAEQAKLQTDLAKRAELHRLQLIQKMDSKMNLDVRTVNL